MVTSLAVKPRAGVRQGTTDWPGTAEDLLAVIAKIDAPEDTEPCGRFRQQNRLTLDLLRRSDKRAWSYVGQQLNERYRQLCEARKMEGDS